MCFQAGLIPLFLFSKPLIRCALDCTAVKVSTRLLDWSSEVCSALALEVATSVLQVLWIRIAKALYTHSSEKQVTSIEDKMPLPPLLNRDASVKLLMEQQVVNYGTLRPPLDESLQFQYLLHCTDLQTMQEGE